jgi:hypothetical protein
MNMNEALVEMASNGKKMVRPGWTENGDTWLEMRQTDPPKLPLLENALYKTKENTYTAWTGSVDDISATDWEERKDPTETEEKPPPGTKPPLGGEGRGKPGDDIGRADKPGHK